MYGDVNGNGTAVLRLYQGRFPGRRMLNHKMFQRLYQQLCENGSFITRTDEMCRSRTAQQTHLEKIVLEYVGETSGADTRTLTCSLHVYQPTVWRVLLLNS
ncbi:hypothetical protein TNCV_503491 [Trichonephila clavipes]|nr:hypothetical protein TNCV_503491 [Trichonephila clavipes]